MLKPRDVNADLVLKFSVDRERSLRHVENVALPWGELVEKLSKSHEDKLTLAQFKDLPKDRQAKRKNNGYFVGAQFKRSIRDKQTMAERQIITFDIDQGTPEILRDLENGRSGLGAIEYVVYSTRTHGDGAIKLRVVIPLEDKLPHEWFQALSRILAWQIDFKMVAVDVVSFVPTQIMYWPAHCADIEPVFIHHKGPLLDVDTTLEEWGPWTDIGMLPRSPRERDLRESGNSKQNPLDKRGIVGAFCRTYDVHTAIDTFLSDVYAPSEVGPDGVPTRYTYMPGSMSNGVQVYTDGHVQSFHGSDPAGGLNLNSFDLVRIHLYGEKDGIREQDDDPRKHRSYQAFSQFLVEDAEVMRDLRDSNYGVDEDDVDDSFDAEADDVVVSEVTSVETEDKVVETEAEDKPEIDWRDKLDMTEKGLVKPTIANLILILRHAKSFEGRFGHNDFTHMDCLMRPLRVPSLKIDCRLPLGAPAMIEEHHLAAIRNVLEAPRGPKKTGWGLRVSDRDLRAAIIRVCRENSFHPIQDYLGVLPWDGVSRIDNLWVKTCHTPNTPYYRAVSRNLLVAAVARVFEPGTKFDFMPVIAGPQGIRKSTLVMTLGSATWSGETEGHFDDKKKFVEASLGFWFLENGEMTQFRRAGDDEAIKAILSGTVDTVRLSYRPDPQRIPRQFILIGTTNATTFLRDRHRRIWTIVCGPGQVDIEWLDDNRDQLFAEAVHEYRRMRKANPRGFLPLYLTGDALAEFETRQDDHLLPNEAEVKAGIVGEWLATPVTFAQSKPGWNMDDTDPFSDDDEMLVLRTHTCAAEIYERALNGDSSKYDMRAAKAIGDVMRHLEPEWRAAPMARCGKYGRQRTYIRVQKRGENDL